MGQGLGLLPTKAGVQVLGWLLLCGVPTSQWRQGCTAVPIWALHCLSVMARAGNTAMHFVRSQPTSPRSAAYQQRAPRPSCMLRALAEACRTLPALLPCSGNMMLASDLCQVLPLYAARLCKLQLHLLLQKHAEPQ